MNHKALRQALQDAAVYPEFTTRVEVRETPLSWVFLTDDYAYKIKKPVELGFADFSTLDRRRLYCDEELRLNRRLSAAVYLEVLPLYRSKRGYTFEEQGAAVDYALKMRRLCEDHSLETLLRRGTLTPAVMQCLAQRLTTFHHEHPLPDGSDHFGTLDQVQNDWEENFTQTLDDIDRTISRKQYRNIREGVTRFMARHADWFAQRVRDGRIRDCHGDLRAEHIYIDPDRLQIIDCIEFNKRFRFIDVASEVAFLAVDLERLGAPQMASQFIHAYVRDTGDVSLYRLLDFYCCYRAYIRGKVTSLCLHQTPDADTQARLQPLAEAYYVLAERYAARLARPLVVLTTGLSASSKSTVAKGVATALDLRILPPEQVRKEPTGGPPQTSPCVPYGAGMDTLESTRPTYDALADQARQALGQGDAVILDAVFSKRAERQRLAALAHDMGADCCLVECVTADAVLCARLKQRPQAAETMSAARMDILESVQQDYDPIEPDEAICHVRIDTAKNRAACVQKALAAIWQQRP